MKKRFCLNFAGIFLLLFFTSLSGLLLSCSDNSPDPELDGGRELVVPNPDLDDELDDENDEIVPEPGDGDGDEEEPPAPDPKAVLLTARVESEREIVFEFSEPVTVQSLSFDPVMEIYSLEEGSTVKVLLEEDLEPGFRFTADLEVEDEWENTITEQRSLISINKRFPELLINELRTEWSNPRTEFIEFMILTDGNLGGLRVFVSSNTRSPMIYEFKPVEVEQGELVVLHLRTLEDSCKDEYGQSLDESGGRDSSTTARDIWIPGSAKLLRKTDAVYVMDMDDKVLSAVMISETPDSLWTRDHFAEAAEFLFKQGAWKSPAGEICTPADAVSSADVGSAATKSISRDKSMENSKTTVDWFVTAAGGASPGQPNTPRE